MQIRRLNRTLKEIGIHPYIVYVLVLPVFVILSKLLFDKTEFADWIYIGIALLLGLRLTDKHRTEELVTLFPKKVFHLIRGLEHFALQLPFMLYLIYEQKFLFAGGLVLASCLLSLYRQQFGIGQVIPTPFKRIPFEFIVGFRQSVIFLLGVYFLLAKAIQVDNYKLSLFCIPVSFLICCSYYFIPEKTYFVWMFNMDTNQFLKHKIALGLFSGLIITLPLCIILMIAYPEVWYFILGLEMLGSVVLLTMILAKYSAFPNEMNIPQVILFVLCLVFPFLLPFAILIFYKQAKRRLIPILG